MYGNQYSKKRGAAPRSSSRQSGGGPFGGGTPAFKAGYQAALDEMRRKQAGGSGRKSGAPGGSKGRSYGTGRDHEEYPSDADLLRGRTPPRVGWRW